MSIKLPKSSNQAPFFPPGISCHKRESSAKRPHTVKHCKKISNVRMTTSLTDYLDNSTAVPHRSKSIPDLKIHHQDHPATISGLHTSEENMNQMTRSLDRFALRSESKNLTGFVPDKPFYPPSKYPSTHDRGNYNVQRLIETRKKYKTPELRKTAHTIARHQSVGNLAKQNKKEKLKDTKNYVSTPDLTEKVKETKPQNLHLQTTHYFYPKPTTNTNDSMTQSLIVEPSFSSIIVNGGLDPSSGDNPHEVLQDECSTKSPTTPKQLKSFTENSLDEIATKMNSCPITDIVDSAKSSVIGADEMSSHDLSSADAQQFIQYFDQFNLDVVTTANPGTICLSSFTYVERNSPITIQNEFLSSNEMYRTVAGDLVSKCLSNATIIKDQDSTDDHSHNNNIEMERSIVDDHKTREINAEWNDEVDNKSNSIATERLTLERSNDCDCSMNNNDQNWVYDSCNSKNDADCIGLEERKFDSTTALYEYDYEKEMRKSNVMPGMDCRLQEDIGKSNDDGSGCNINDHKATVLPPFKGSDNNNADDLRKNATDSAESASTSELSWSGDEDNKSLRDGGNDSAHIQPGTLSWMSSPDLCSTNYNVTGRHVRPLQIENPLNPRCSRCHMPAYLMERISISNIIFHKSCFRCRKCDTHLNFNNCIIHRNRPYCQVHMRPKIRRRLRSASTNKLSHIKEKLDHKSNLQKQSSTEVKQPKRIFYDGIKSAKTKFLDDATKITEKQTRDPKRITPPRQGVDFGIIESEPKPRDPNVITCGDNQNTYYDEMTQLTQSNSAKETRAHFRDLQDKSNGSKGNSNVESGESKYSRRADVISVDTKSLRNTFLGASLDSDTKVKKINPSDEIQRLVKLGANFVYENEPESRTDVIKSDSLNDDETASPITRNKARELKERFSNFAQDDKPRRFELKLDYAEGGIYESHPQENDTGVIKHNYDTNVDLPENTVKSGLQRIKELQDIKSQGYQKANKEPITLEMDPSLSGIYENTPEQSRADSKSCQNSDSLIEFREKNYTNDAKKAFLEKQKQNEEESLKKSTPHMIDIWKDLCPDSGIFENQPTEQRHDVIKCDDSTDTLEVNTDTNESNCEEEKSAPKESEENDVSESK